MANLINNGFSSVGSQIKNVKSNSNMFYTTESNKYKQVIEDEEESTDLVCDTIYVH
eukprot:Pgem_evm1s16808